MQWSRSTEDFIKREIDSVMRKFDPIVLPSLYSVQFCEVHNEGVNLAGMLLTNPSKPHF